MHTACCNELHSMLHSADTPGQASPLTPVGHQVGCRSGCFAAAGGGARAGVTCVTSLAASLGRHAAAACRQLKLTKWESPGCALELTAPVPLQLLPPPQLPSCR
jgi:hypothetical protein